MGETKKTVCIVEDDLAVRNALVALLESRAYIVRSFVSAEEFLREDMPHFDCLIVDIRLPGMSGLELLDRLADAGLSGPTVVVTGHGESEEVSRMTPLNTIQLLKKPWNPKDLLAAISKAVN